VRNRIVVASAAGALLALVFAGHASAQPAAGAAPPPPVASPEIAANGDVTLRLRAPQAGKVTVVSGGDIPPVPNTGLALEKGADGVWQVTLSKLAGGAYRYRFMVDGVPTDDPANPAVSQSNSNTWSLFYVPGAKFMDEQRVAFGDLAEYAYVGVFSSGVFDVRDSSQWEDEHRAQLDDAALKRGLNLVWFSTGRDDRLLDTTAATVDLLKRHGFAVSYEPSAGAHTWINWREYLNKFAPQLFEK
jgi:hypothetical protein